MEKCAGKLNAHASCGRMLRRTLLIAFAAVASVGGGIAWREPVMAQQPTPPAAPEVRQVKLSEAQVQGFLDTWLPRLRSETRSYVTVAFGCSGGRHRSVYLAERLARHCRETGWAEVAVHHRELD